MQSYFTKWIMMYYRICIIESKLQETGDNNTTDKIDAKKRNISNPHSKRQWKSRWMRNIGWGGGRRKEKIGVKGNRWNENILTEEKSTDRLQLRNRYTTEKMELTEGTLTLHAFRITSVFNLRALMHLKCAERMFRSNLTGISTDFNA